MRAVSILLCCIAIGASLSAGGVSSQARPRVLS